MAAHKYSTGTKVPELHEHAHSDKVEEKGGEVDKNN